MANEMPHDPEADARVELAELQDEAIDDSVLHRLFEDLDALAEIIEVRVKGAPVERAQDRTVRLRDALDLLLEGRIRGAQVVYEYRGRTWCDTIVRHEGGQRLVRMESPRRPASAALWGEEPPAR